jgi:hypothetical protein
MKKKTKRYMKFEEARLQSSFLEQLRSSGIVYKLSRMGAVVFGDKDAAGVVSAAHRVRDAQFPWYFLKWKTEREAARFRAVLTKTNVPFIVEQHEDGTWFVVRRADRASHERLWPQAMKVGEGKSQAELHAAAEKYVGVLSGLGGGLAETVRETVRRRVRERISGSRKKADSSPRSE